VSVSAIGTIVPDERGSLETLGRGVGLNYLLVNEGRLHRTYSTFAAGFDAVVASPREDETYAGVEYSHYLTARLVDKPMAPYASLGVGLMGEVGATATDRDGDGEVDPEQNGGLSWHAAGGLHGFVHKFYWATDLGYQGGPANGMRARAALGYIVGSSAF